MAESRRQLLLRNLGFGAVAGAGIGVLQAVSDPATANLTAVLGYALGGAIGGAILFVLMAAIWTAILR